MGIKFFNEVTSGFSAQASGESGGVSYTRVFKVILDTPQEINTFNAVSAIALNDGAFFGIGTPHPLNNYATCDSISVDPEGESRLAYTITVSYRPSRSGNVSLEEGGVGDNTPDPRNQEPSERLANWSTSTTTIEVPSWLWRPQWGNNANQWVPAHNPVGDLVDGVTVLQPIVSINVEQYCQGDQTKYSQYVGSVNSKQGRFGSLNFFPRSVLFKSVSFKPHSEMWGDQKWRGWLGSFEFLYKPNFNNYLNEYIGWDIAIPLSGYNIFNGQVGGGFGNDVDKGACHLTLENDVTGAIKDWPNPTLAPNTAGNKMRANVLITTPTDTGTRASQRPSAMPVPLNEDGTPRDPKNANPVLIRRYQVYNEFDFAQLGIRLR